MCFCLHIVSFSMLAPPEWVESHIIVQWIHTMWFCFDILHVPKWSLSIEKMSVHRYRDNIFDVVLIIIENFLQLFKFSLALCLWEWIALFWDFLHKGQC